MWLITVLALCIKNIDPLIPCLHFASIYKVSQLRHIIIQSLRGLCSISMFSLYTFSRACSYLSYQPQFIIFTREVKL